MAQIVVNRADLFPVGMTVEAYLQSVWPGTAFPPAPGSAVPGGASATSSAVVASDGSLTITGLGDATKYVLRGSNAKYLSVASAPAAAAAAGGGWPARADWTRLLAGELKGGSAHYDDAHAAEAAQYEGVSWAVSGGMVALRGILDRAGRTSDDLCQVPAAARPARDRRGRVHYPNGDSIGVTILRDGTITTVTSSSAISFIYLDGLEYAL